VTNKIAFENLFDPLAVTAPFTSITIRPLEGHHHHHLCVKVVCFVLLWLCFSVHFRFSLFFSVPSARRFTGSVRPSALLLSVDHSPPSRSFTMRKALREMKNVVYQFSPIELKVRRERESSDSDRRR
jgi:hypothetical protein